MLPGRPDEPDPEENIFSIDTHVIASCGLSDIALMAFPAGFS